MGAGSGVYSPPDGSAEADYGDFSWVLTTTPAVGNTIYGYWVDYVFPGDGSSRSVAVWEPISPPIPMTANGNAVVLSVPITLPLPSSATFP